MHQAVLTEDLSAVPANTTPPDAKRPSWTKLLAEAPAAARLLAAQVKRPPIVLPHAGRGRPVLVLPAFLANDIPTRLLRRTLEASDFRPMAGRTASILVHVPTRWNAYFGGLTMCGRRREGPCR